MPVAQQPQLVPLLLVWCPRSSPLYGVGWRAWRVSAPVSLPIDWSLHLCIFFELCGYVPSTPVLFAHLRIFQVLMSKSHDGIFLQHNSPRLSYKCQFGHLSADQ